MIQNVIATLVLLVSVLLVRTASKRYVRRQEWRSDEMRLRWHVRLRNIALFVFLLGLVIIWATELRTLALSAVAVAAALVIATKELILCISGGVLRASTESFDVGDRVEIAGMRGDVINYGLMTTTIMEIGPNHLRTGRAVVVPNSLLLSNNVINESFTDDYVLHTFNIPLRPEDNWRDAEALLLETARTVSAPYLEEAKKQMESVAHRHGLPAPSADPRVTVQVPEGGKVTVSVRLPTPADEKGSNEQRILRRFLDEFPSPTVGVEDSATETDVPDPAT